MKRTVLALIALLTVPFAWAQETQLPLARVTTDRTSVIPGQPITLRVSVLVPTWMPKPPEFPNLDVPGLIIREAKQVPRPFSERIGGETWSGVSRVYLVYPMRPGEVRIAPSPLKVTVAVPGSPDPSVFEIPVDEILVEGIRPETAVDLDPFIAAKSVEIEQAIEGAPANLEPGDAFTRVVTVTVEGVSPIFIPELVAALDRDWIAEYSDEPVVEETGEGETIAGRRVERITYVSSAGGRATLPPLRLRWFNLETGQIIVTEAPAIDIASRGPVSEISTEPRDLRGIAPFVIGFVVTLSVSGMLARRFWPSLRGLVSRQVADYRVSEPFAYRTAMRAIAARDFNKAVMSIDRWRALAQPQDSARLQNSMAVLGAHRFGPCGRANVCERSWISVQRTLRELRKENRRNDPGLMVSTALPPLNPTSRQRHE